MSRRQSFSSFGATSLEHEASVLARHASAEAMRLGASSVVRLKSALRHRNEFSLKTKRVRLAAPCVYVKERATDQTDIKTDQISSESRRVICGQYRCSTMMCTRTLLS